MTLRERVDLAMRIGAAALVLAGGVVHLKLWNDVYRDANPEWIGPAFLLNVIGSAATAVALVVWRHWIPVVSGLLLVDGTMLGFGLSRTKGGLLDFSESGWIPAPEAALALAFEAGAAAVLVALIAVGISERPSWPAFSRRG
jgi:hypothetical protein